MGEGMESSERVIVAGAGIGGLTAAIALRRAGIEVAVFERAVELREVGAGLLLAANAVKALGRLGLSDALQGIGVPATAGSILSWRGQTLFELDASELKKATGADSFAVHRADLQQMLLGELDKAGGTVHVGKKLEGFEQSDDDVRASFADGTEEHAGLFVGADGLRSRVRAGLFGEREPVYAGYTSWRAIAVPERGLVPSGNGFESWGRGRRFGCAHVGGAGSTGSPPRTCPRAKETDPAGPRPPCSKRSVAGTRRWKG